MTRFHNGLPNQTVKVNRAENQKPRHGYNGQCANAFTRRWRRNHEQLGGVKICIPACYFPQSTAIWEDCETEWTSAILLVRRTRPCYSRTIRSHHLLFPLGDLRLMVVFSFFLISSLFVTWFPRVGFFLSLKNAVAWIRDNSPWTHPLSFPFSLSFTSITKE